MGSSPTRGSKTKTLKTNSLRVGFSLFLGCVSYGLYEKISPLLERNPCRIRALHNLGGECSVSVPVFIYLADKYIDDVTIVWLPLLKDKDSE